MEEGTHASGLQDKGGTAPFTLPFDFPERSESIHLWNGKSRLSHQKTSRPTEIRLKWRPSPRIVFEQTSSEIDDLKAFFSNSQGNTHISLDDQSASAEASVTSSNPPKGTISHISRGNWESVEVLQVHIFNFPNAHLPQPIYEKTDAGERWWSGASTIEGDGWNFEIQTVRDAREAYHRLGEDGGYELTHVARLRRASIPPLASFQFTDIAIMLQTFLSFSRGAWSSPMLPVGFNAIGEQIWEEWSTPFVSAGRSSLSWFDPHHSEALRDVGSAIFQLWSDANDWPLFRRAVALYLDANRTSLDAPSFLETRILIALSALELIVSGTIGRSERSPEMTFPDALNDALERAGIPANPASKLSDADQTIDGPSLLLEVRNSVLHSTPRPSYPTDINLLLESWHLAMWYIEMLLLHKLGFQGQYASRLQLPRWVGQAEAVPWSQSDTDRENS